MPQCCEPRLQRFIPLLPSGAVLVMKASRLKLAVETVIKKFANFVLYIPKTLFKTWLRIQIKIVCFPFVFVPAILRLTSRRNASQQVSPCLSITRLSTEPGGSAPALITESSTQPRNLVPASIEEPCLEPRSEDIVRQVKRLRNSVIMSITHLTGGDVFRDVPILRQKVTRFSEAYIEGDRVKIAAAKKALEEHPKHHPKFKSKEEYSRMMEEARRGAEHSAANRIPKLRLERKTSLRKTSKYAGNETKPGVSNMLKNKKVVAFADSNRESGNIGEEECESTDRRHDMKLSLQNRRLRSQLGTTNNKLEDLLKSSNNLLVEVAKLNGQFNKLTTVTTKMTHLECELSEGKKLLREIEEERNEMKVKLLALEQLIKEEEDFLDDLSCESGYEEVENICDSHDEL